MKTSDKAFGENYASKFKIGDLVWWVTWEQDENYSIHSVIHKGALIDIVSERGDYSHREVCFAVVLPYGSQKTIKINITLLRKGTNYDKEAGAFP
jgi:hypothetical protein